MNILCIGNSFSQDSTRYLHRIARADAVSVDVCNLYVPGCTLAQHYGFMLSEENAYELEYNGELTKFKVSLKQALTNRQWDYISFQQASHKCTDYDSYTPYLSELCEYVKKCCPKAKIIIHQTWAYEEGSNKLCDLLGYNLQKDMYTDLEKAYSKAAADISANLVVPSGMVMQKLIERGVSDIHRDTYHLSYGTGRYASALMWYKMLTGNCVHSNNFNDFDEEISESKIEIIKACVEDVFNQVCR